jgi:hypothetical protein
MSDVSYSIDLVEFEEYVIEYATNPGPEGPVLADEDTTSITRTVTGISGYPSTPLTPYLDGESVCITPP